MRLFLEDAGDQMLQMGRSRYMFRKSKTALLYFFIGVFHVLGLKGWPPIDQGVDDHAKTPDVDLITVSFRL